MFRAEAPRRHLRYFTGYVVGALIYLSLLWLGGGCQKMKEPPAPLPPEVLVAEIISRDVPIESEWVGTADGLVNATIRAQVSGYLIKQAYAEGDPVNQGDVLFLIDPRPFQQALDQAEGTLAQLTAQHENAAANLKRVRPLATENALSQKDLDDATGAERSSAAAVVAARAAVEKAKLDLGFTRITSPIHGVAGIARAQVGDLVGPAQGGELATVSVLDPIKVYYTITEEAYLALMKRFPGGLNPESKLNIELILGDGSTYPAKGRFFALDRQIDIRTGTMRVAATFPNPHFLLRPGQFLRVRVQTGIHQGALLVPQRAVLEFQGSFQVAVVSPDNHIEIRQVKPGERLGQLWLIESGLKPSERVVAEGGGKVKQGMPVTPKPFAFPDPSSPAAAASAQALAQAAGKR